MGSDGRVVTLEGPPKRIISLSPGITENLFAIGAGGNVVAVDRFSDFPEAVRSLPKVDYTSPNVESVLALNPDLVIASSRQRNVVPSFEQAGLRVWTLDEPASLASTVDQVRLIGTATNASAKANALADAMQARMDAIAAKIGSLDGGPRVYHEIDPKLFSAASNTFVGDFYRLLKAQNIAASAVTPFPQLTDEAIIAADPEVMILTDAKFMAGGADEVRGRPGWTAITAIRTGRVYELDDDLLSRPGPRVIDGLEQLAQALYPELFR